MCMQTNNYRFSVLYIATEPFDLIRIHIRCRHLYRGRQIKNNGFLCRRLPDVSHSVANLDRKPYLCAGKTLRGILKLPIRIWRQIGTALDFLRSRHRDFDDARLVGTKDFLALNNGSRVVDMKNRFLCSLQGFESSLNQCRSCLSENLNSYVIWNFVLFNKTANKIEVRLRSSRKTDLNLLKANGNEKLEHLLFLRH